MDDFSPLTTSSLNIHHLEIFTSNLVIQGDSTGPFRRASDLVNRKDRDYLLLEGARITPLGRQSNMTPLGTPLMVVRPHIHFVALAPQPEPEDTTGALGQYRESGVHKVPYPCYMLTDVFVLMGECHMVEGATLENLMTMTDLFLAITKATVYINSMPNNPLSRDLVIVNKDKIQGMYLMPSPTTTKKLEEASVASAEEQKPATEEATASAEPAMPATEQAAPVEPPGASTSSLLDRLTHKDRTS